MNMPPFERQTQSREHGPRWTETMLAKVETIGTGERNGQIEIILYNYREAPNTTNPTQDAKVWARVAVPMAGGDRGTFLLPKKGDEVLVTFVGGDPRRPIIIGSLWNGSQQAPETLDSDVDRWSFTSPAGTTIKVQESSLADSNVSIVIPRTKGNTDPEAASASIFMSGSGEMVLRAGGSTLTINAEGIRASTTGQVCLDGSTILHQAVMMDVQVPMTSFAGMTEAVTAQCEMQIATIQATCVGSVL